MYIIKTSNFINESDYFLILCFCCILILFFFICCREEDILETIDTNIKHPGHLLYFYTCRIEFCKSTCLCRCLLNQHFFGWKSFNLPSFFGTFSCNLQENMKSWHTNMTGFDSCNWYVSVMTYTYKYSLFTFIKCKYFNRS